MMCRASLRASAYFTLAVVPLCTTGTGAGKGRGGATWTNPRDGSEMVSVPAGPFRMGSNKADD